MALGGRRQQRGAAVAVLPVDLRAAPQQEVDRRRVAPHDRFQELGCQAPGIARRRCSAGRPLGPGHGLYSTRS